MKVTEKSGDIIYLTDMNTFTDIFKDAFSLLVIVDPLASIPVFLTLTSHQKPAKQKITARRATLAAFLILLSSAIAGKIVLNLFGVSLASIRAAGGLLFLYMGIELLRAQYKKLSNEEQEEAELHSDVAVVPLALPILSGPGAMGAVIVASDKGSLLHTLPMQGITIGFVMFVTWLCLRSAQYIGSKLGVTGINILNRVLGLLLVALGFEFLLNGCKTIWFG